jgi:hypothetical protein
MTPEQGREHMKATTGQAAARLAAGQPRQAGDRRKVRLTRQEPGHDILPLSGAVYQVGKSLPASLDNPVHYPVEARCQRCPGQVLCDQSDSDWRHEEPAP